MIGVRFLANTRDFLSAIESRLALRPTQPPTQWAPWAPLPVGEADLSLVTSDEIQNVLSYTSISLQVFMA
jgi:hypothetical protein